jgi:hypothetical protein
MPGYLEAGLWGLIADRILLPGSLPCHCLNYGIGQRSFDIGFILAVIAIFMPNLPRGCPVLQALKRQAVLHFTYLAFGEVLPLFPGYLHSQVLHCSGIFPLM